MGFPLKLFSLGRLMVFGVLMGQRVGKGVIMCTKYAPTIKAPYESKSAPPMIHILEGRLVISAIVTVLVAKATLYSTLI